MTEDIVTLKKLLIKKLGLSRQSVEKKRDILKSEYGPMTDTEAYSAMCQINGINSTPYIDNETALRVREICSRIKYIKNDSTKQDSISPVPSDLKFSKANRKIEKISLKDPILKPQILSDAILMSKIYAQIYIFENSLRQVICKIMEKYFGDNWWDSLSTPKAIKMRTDADRRINDEKRNPWHGKRGKLKWIK